MCITADQPHVEYSVVIRNERTTEKVTPEPLRYRTQQHAATACACLLGRVPLLADLSICRTKIYTLVSKEDLHEPCSRILLLALSNPFIVKRYCSWQKEHQPRNVELECSAKEMTLVLEAPPVLLDPYAPDHRKAVIGGKIVQGYLRSRGSTVTIHSRKLPRLPLANTMKRQFKKPTVVRLGEALRLEVTGLLGSGGFAHVFAASASTDQGKTATDVAIKVRSQLY